MWGDVTHMAVVQALAHQLSMPKRNCVMWHMLLGHPVSACHHLHFHVASPLSPSLGLHLLD